MSHRSPLHYIIPKRQQRCSVCQTLFLPSCPYFTFLIAEELENIMRYDLCPNCSEAFDKRGQAQIFWQGVIPKKNARDHAREPLKKMTDLLKELASSQDEKAMGQAALLSLYLKRKRLIALRYEENPAEGPAFLWHELIHSGELIAIPKCSVDKGTADELDIAIKARLG